MTTPGKPQHGHDQTTGTKSRGNIRIFVKTLSNKKIEVAFDSQSDTVDDLKSKIQEIEGIPSHEQRLVFLGRRLTDGQTLLRDYQVQKESTLHVLTPMKQGPTQEGDPVHCIPEYEVLDASSIQIRETNSEFQQSLATNGFTSRCIEAGL